MKKIVIWLILNVASTFAQTYIYDFGVESGAHEADTSTVFLPQPPIGSARVRVGSGGGGFYLQNPGLSDFGSDSELKGVASSTSSVNKFSLYGLPNAKQFYLAFLVRFSGAASGKWYLCAGSGNSYSNNALFRSDQTFLAFRWSYLERDSLLCEYRKGGSWKKLPTVMSKQNKIYYVEFYGNNSGDSLTYRKNGTQKLNPNSFDLWVNDSLLSDNLSKALLADSLFINALMFYGANSDSNSAVIYLDNISYDDSLANEVSVLEEKYIYPRKREEFILYHNYPNPFNPSTTIKFSLPQGQNPLSVFLTIFDGAGNIMDKIYIGRLTGGIHTYNWEAKKKTASGQYFIRLQAGSFIKSAKMVLLK